MIGKRCVVAAYHDVGYVGLETMLKHGWDVLLVYTHADPAGEPVWWRSVAELAAAQGIPVETADINDPAQVERVRALTPDFLFSFYYRKMIRPEVLAIPASGALNLHGSLLPKFRGRAPVNWAIISGEQETGMTLHYMIEKPDAGDVVDQEWVPIEDDDTALTVYQRLCEASVNVLDRALSWFERDKAPRFAQDLSKGSYFRGRTPEDGRIDFAQEARRCYDLVRAVTHPYPGAFGEAGTQRYFVWSSKAVKALPSGRTAAPGTLLLEGGVPHVACGSGWLRLERVTPPGAEEMDGSEAASRGSLPEGMRFFASNAGSKVPA